MNIPNKHGVYENKNTDEIARKGKAFASIRWCQCQDGLYRYSLFLRNSYSSFCEPITDRSTGYTTAALARGEAIAVLLGRLPKPSSTQPQSVHAELKELRRQIERQFMQPSLF